MGRLFLIALRNIQANKRRTVFLGGSILSVTVLLVILSAVLNGVRTTLITTGTTLMTGHVNIAGFFKPSTGQSAPTIVDFKPLLELAKQEVPDAVIVDRLRGWGKVVSDTGSMQLGMAGIDVVNETRFKETITVVSGSTDELARPHTALIFEKQAARLGVKVGDRLTLSTTTLRGAYNSVDVEVVAIGKDLGMISGFQMYASKDAIRDVYLLNENLTGAILLYLPDPDQAETVAERLRAAIAAKGYRTLEPLSQPFWMKFPIVNREDWTGQKIDVTTWDDEMAFLLFSLKAIGGVRLIIGIVLLIVVIGGTLNAMWMAIRERTREIGTLRAVGMGRGGVLLMFLIETVMLTAGSALAGAIVGNLIAVGLDYAQLPTGEFSLFLMRDTLRLLPDIEASAMLVGLITGVIGVFALLPARKAARLQPVQAMQHAG